MDFVSKSNFDVNDVVLAFKSDFLYWPGIIIKKITRRSYIVKFINDDIISTVNSNNIKKLFIGDISSRNVKLENKKLYTALMMALDIISGNSSFDNNSKCNFNKKRISIANVNLLGKKRKDSINLHNLFENESENFSINTDMKEKINQKNIGNFKGNYILKFEEKSERIEKEFFNVSKLFEAKPNNIKSDFSNIKTKVQKNMLNVKLNIYKSNRANETLDMKPNLKKINDIKSNIYNYVTKEKSFKNYPKLFQKSKLNNLESIYCNNSNFKLPNNKKSNNLCVSGKSNDFIDKKMKCFNIEEIYHNNFKQEISEINENIYLGDDIDLKNRKLLLSLKIDYILSVGKKSIEYHKDLFTYYYIVIKDDSEELILPYFNSIIQFIDMCISKNNKIFIHCADGDSRNSSLLISYFIHKYNFNVTEAIYNIKNKRNIIIPNYGFKEQLSFFYLKENNHLNKLFKKYKSEIIYPLIKLKNRKKMHLYQEITNKKRYCIKKNIKLNTMKLNLNFDLIVICKLYIFLEEKITMMELENKSLVDITKNLRDIFCKKTDLIRDRFGTLRKYEKKNNLDREKKIKNLISRVFWIIVKIITNRVKQIDRIKNIKIDNYII